MNNKQEEFVDLMIDSFLQINKFKKNEAEAKEMIRQLKKICDKSAKTLGLAIDWEDQTIY